MAQLFLALWPVGWGFMRLVFEVFGAWCAVSFAVAALWTSVIYLGYGYGRLGTRGDGPGCLKQTNESSFSFCPLRRTNSSRSATVNVIKCLRRRFRQRNLPPSRRASRHTVLWSELEGQ